MSETHFCACCGQDAGYSDGWVLCSVCWQELEQELLAEELEIQPLEAARTKL